MSQRQTLIIIPGFGESKKDVAYTMLKKELGGLGYKIIFHTPKWKRNTVQKWLSDFDKFFQKYKKRKPIVLGFSFGAYVALLSATKFIFSKLILCSLSPYFKDNIKNLPPLAYKILGQKRMRAFKQHDLPKNIKIPARFLVGDKDLNIVIKRSISAYKKYKGNKKLVIIKDAEHDLNNRDYIKGIKKALLS